MKTTMHSLNWLAKWQQPRRLMKTVLLAAVLAGAALSSAHAQVVVANAAADYTNSAAPASLPDGWTYFYSDTNSGGTEVALATNAAIGLAGNTGFGRDGTITIPGGGNSYNVPTVLGSHTSEQYEIFSDGYDGNGGTIPTGNEGVVGTDLLLHPGSAAGAEYVIVRYTISATDILNGTYATIAGSFRDLCGRPDRDPPAESITADIYHNATSLFSVTGGTTAQGTPSYLLEATGTFNITGLPVAAGDTISFVVGNNGNFSGDETALQATIILQESAGSPVIVVEPHGGEIQLGDPLDLSVTALGEDPLTYLWRKDGTLIGAPNSSDFSIGSSTVGDAGDYDVVVTNMHGSITSAVAVVTVNTLPFITEEPQGADILLGDPLNLSVTADGPGPLTYVWRKGGASLGAPNTSSYTIGSVTVGDAGSFDVVVTNAYGAVTSVLAVVTVNTPPQGLSTNATTVVKRPVIFDAGNLGGDVDGDPLTIVAAPSTSTNYGVVSFNGSAIVYSPASWFTGLDGFTCTIGDGRGGTATSEIIVNVVNNTSGTQVVADPAYDYVSGNYWTYVFSDAAVGGIETALFNGNVVGNAGNIGFGGSAAFNTPCVLGVATDPNVLQIFNDGNVNSPLAGVDLLLHPGNNAYDKYVVARYMVQGGDVTAYGTNATIVGSFRELVLNSTSATADSVEVQIYKNTELLFAATGASGGVGINKMLTEAAGTFNVLTTVAGGDTLSFVVSARTNYTGDETALRGTVVLSVLPPVVAPVIVTPPVITDGNFHVGYSGTPNSSYRVDRATNINGPWEIGFTNPVAGPTGLFELVDALDPAIPVRFYRAVVP